VGGLNFKLGRKFGGDMCHSSGIGGAVVEYVWSRGKLKRAVKLKRLERCPNLGLGYHCEGNKGADEEGSKGNGRPNVGEQYRSVDTPRRAIIGPYLGVLQKGKHKGKSDGSPIHR